MKGKAISLLVITMILFAYTLHAIPTSTTKTPSHLFIDSPSGVYQKSATRWKDAISQHDVSGITLMGRIPGNGYKDNHHYNGGRDTIIFIPAGLSSERQIEIIYFLHGLRGFGKRDFKIRIVPAIKKMIASKRNFIIIIPELPWSSNTTTPTSRQNKAWRDKDGTTLVRFFIHIHQIFHGGFEMPIFDASPRVTIVAHSAGGGALRTAAQEKVLEVLDPDVIIMSESSYANWANEVWEHYVKDRPKCKLVFLLLKGGEPYQRTQKLLKRIGDTSHSIKVKIYERPEYSHEKVGDRSLIDSKEFVYK